MGSKRSRADSGGRNRNPDIDVPAVQAAVDQGGNVILKGHFSFNRPPTVPTATGFVGGLATVLLSKAVAISGTQNGDDEMASIEGGTTPFYVEASGASVTIQGLRFIRPTGDAIFVYAVSGLVIASCKIEGTIGGDGIDIITSGGIPNPTNPARAALDVHVFRGESRVTRRSFLTASTISSHRLLTCLSAWA